MEPREIPQSVRRTLVLEMERWLKQGTISPAQFYALSHQYDFDFRSSPPPEKESKSQLIQAPLAAVMPPVQPPQPKPHLTLAQTLLSEMSIKIALYLGAFFVISAALILAALVADLRLPILLVVMVLFASGALALKRRLPQPSFILYLVFSALLPITSKVLADYQSFTDRALILYWLLIFLGMALIWAFSTYLYKSRFFSLAAVVSFDAAFIAAGLLTDKYNLALFLFFLTLSSLAGVAAAFALKRWKGWRMALPIFALAQSQQALILLITVVSALIFEEKNLLYAIVFFLSSGLAVLCNFLFPFVLYPWVAATAMAPVASMIMAHFDHRTGALGIALSGWGAVYTLAGNLFARARERMRVYTLPLSVTAILLLALGSIYGLVENSWICFGICLGAALVLTLAHLFYRRIWLWTIALGFSLGAYLSLFYSLSGSTTPPWCSWLAGATLLLLLPELILSPQKLSVAWRWPLRGWAILTGVLTLATGLALYFQGSEAQSKVALFTLGMVALLYFIYAIRIHQPWLGLLFSLHLTLALALGLHRYGINSWLSALTCLAVIFYGSGVILKGLKIQSWSGVFRWSGLGLGGILSLTAFAYAGPIRAFDVAAIAFLFLMDVFRYSTWLEIIPAAIFSLAFGMGLYDARVDSFAYYSAGTAGIFLLLDLLYLRLKRHEIRWITPGVGFVAALFTPIVVVLPQFKPLVGIIVCASLTVIFLAQALSYRRTDMGYSVTTFFTLSVLFVDLNYANRWLWSMILTAVFFYGLSFVLDRARQAGWSSVLRISGLSLASVTAISAPLERSGLMASIPVALAATLWAVEALRRRNVWLGLPANGLYLMSYFMILAALRVDQPQYYSVGAALLGMLMHYLLVRVGSKTGAFLMGMLSQLVLIGTSYIQFVNTQSLWYFLVMFLQSLAVLAYGIIIRSRSLVITPIILVVIGVATAVFGALRGFSTVILVGTTGIGLIVLGIVALLMRERITNLRDLLKDWHA